MPVLTNEGSLLSGENLATVLGLVSDAAGVVAVVCAVAAIPSAGATLPCLAAAAAISTAAGAAEVAVLFAVGDERAPCKAGVFAVGAVLPGRVDEFGPLEQIPIVVVKEILPLGAGLGC